MTKKSIQRHNIILKRKNFLPSLIITLLLFLSLSSIVYFTTPPSPLFMFLFFINLFAFLFFLFSLILISSRRGLLTSLVITLFLLLRLFGVGNILNLIFLVGLAIIVEIYAHFKK